MVCQQTLQVKNFNAHQVKASAMVTRFYREGMDPVKANIEPWDADEPEIEKASFNFDARVPNNHSHQGSNRWS